MLCEMEMLMLCEMDMLMLCEMEMLMLYKTKMQDADEDTRPLGVNPAMQHGLCDAAVSVIRYPGRFPPSCEMMRCICGTAWYELTTSKEQTHYLEVCIDEGELR